GVAPRHDRCDPRVARARREGGGHSGPGSRPLPGRRPAGLHGALHRALRAADRSRAARLAGGARRRRRGRGARMKVLITGATGYLGARVARTLAAGGHEVRVLCRPGREAAVPAGCAPAIGDLLDASALRAALAGREALVHMAAMVKRWARDRAAFD